MHLFTSEGIVIHKLKYLESDLIVTIFSITEGKIKAIVKGGVNSRKRFPGAFEVGNIGEFGFTAKNPYQLMYINHAKVNDYLIELKKDYDKIIMLFYLLGITDAMLIEHQSHPKLFEFLVYTIQFLEKNKALNQVRLFYEFHLLKETGLLPAIEKCESCGMAFAGNRVNFLQQTGKLVCESCIPYNTGSFPIPDNLLLLLKAVNNNSLNMDEFLNVDVPHAMFDITTMLMSNYIDRPLKIWQMIDTICF